MRKLFGIIFLLLICSCVAFAQIDEFQARQELDKRGIGEDEIRTRLLERGINLDRIDPTDATAVMEAEQALKEVVEEIEIEKEKAREKSKEAALNRAKLDKMNKESKNTPLPEGEAKVDAINKSATEEELKEVAKSSEEITESIKEGATLEEAVAEEIIDIQENELPDAVIYGQEIFRNKSLSIYRQAENVKPPNSYVLGIGDVVAVSIWGYSQESVLHEINEAGYIQPDNMPRIYLKGISLGKAKKLLESRFGKYYRFRPQEFELTLNFSRTITVNIVGEVYNYGSFTLPAINTAFNALVASGGPSNIGSVRNIKLIRAGQQPIVIDVYKYLMDPTIESEKKLFLQENDYIYVPVADRVVTISGAINRPFKYELNEGENLKDLIKYAGGLTYNAYLGNIQVKRIINDNEKILDVNYEQLKNTDNDFRLQNGDVIEVAVVEKVYENYAEVTGAVGKPGIYAISDGMSLRELIEKGGGLTEQAKLDVAFLQRLNDDYTYRYQRVNLDDVMKSITSEDNIILRPKDKLIIYGKANFVDKAEVTVSGYVRSPSKYPYDVSQSMRISDLLTLSGGLLPTAAEYGYIKKMDSSNKKVHGFKRINIKKLLEEPESPENITLDPFDEIMVFSKENFTDDATVEIEGAIRKAGKYSYKDGFKISDLIYFSNGLRLDATDFGYIHRPSLSNPDEKEYIRINVKKAVDSPQSLENIILQPNDKLIVFSTTAYSDQYSVSVKGSVRKEGDFQYHESLSLKDVLTFAGGLKKEAASNRIDIFRLEIDENKKTKSIVATLKVDADLSVEGFENGFPIEPYDLIVVRNAPEFELQQTVTIGGEVKYPGIYALLSDNEPLSSVIKRAGGISEEAFPEGATLYRTEDQTGYIMINMDKVLKKPKGKYDLVLKDEDIIEVPKTKDFVTIRGATKLQYVYSQKIAETGKINVPFIKRRNAKYYVNEYAAGVSEKGRKRLIYVEYPNGKIKRTKNFGLFRIYPKVKKGSIISVEAVQEKPKDILPEGQEKTDWGKVLSQTITQATAVLSLILLVQRID